MHSPDQSQPAAPSLSARWILARVVPIGLILVTLAVGTILILSPRSTADAVPPLQGTTLHAVAAPNFRLSDQFGHRVSLTQFRGRVVVLTFFYTRCPDTCPLTAEKLRDVIRGLGKEGKRVVVLAVTTDPARDTQADARRFLRLHGMLHPWHFLLGRPSQVAPVWNAYHVYAVAPGSPAAKTAGAAHTAGIYLIDQQGQERAYVDDVVPPSEIANDLHILLGDTSGLAPIPSAPQLEAAAPDFTLPRLGGSRLHLRQLRGKTVLLNFWATWCVPCRSEMPRLQQAYRQFASQGLVVVGVDRQDAPDVAQAFVKARHVSFPIALDRDGSIGYLYQIYGTPTSFFIDRRGIIRAIKVGELKPATLQAQVKKTLSS